MSKLEKHYVYACYVDGELKYIGNGVGQRYKHCTSGASHVVELNRDLFAGKKLEVKKTHKNLTKSQAEDIEEELIRVNFDSLYNKVVKQYHLPDVPNILRKKDFKILAKTFSTGDEEEYFQNYLSNYGIDEEARASLHNTLLCLGLSLYVVQQGTTKPMIVIDKTRELDHYNWEYQFFSHFEHPEGLYDYREGMRLALQKD